jgi:type VI secretion system secreted protein VgrG
MGMKLHAASGNVNMQAQSGGITVTAAKAIDIQSTTANITISAPSSLMLNGSGGYIKINGGDIEIGTSGPASFKASMKELAGGADASIQGFELIAAGKLSKKPTDVAIEYVSAEGGEPLGAPLQFRTADGQHHQVSGTERSKTLSNVRHGLASPKKK